MPICDQKTEDPIQAFVFDVKDELTLKELQAESLKILKDVHRFCVAHGIMYSVGYGTLIGAIRHQGFIPWDDDIDIIMHRKDYIRFCETYSSVRYQLKCREKDPDCYIAFARVYDTTDTTTDTTIPWCKDETGVWIDIFPIDCVSDREEAYRKHKSRLWRKWKSITVARAATLGFRKDKPLSFNVRLIMKKALTWNGRLTGYLVDRFIRYTDRLKLEKSAHWSQLTYMDGYDWHRVEDFVGTAPMRFEDTEVMVMNGYDRILRDSYGDYMQLPPEEEQVGHSDGLTRFYWKRK